LRGAATLAVIVAIPASVARASPKEDRTAAPERIVVVAGGCESEPVEAIALAAALRVEMVQEGVSAVDVVAAGSPAPREASSATVRLLPAYCATPEALPGFEIEDGATGRSARGTLAIADIDLGVRPRVAALVIAERLRASWADLASVSAASGPPVDRADAPDSAGVSPPDARRSLAEPTSPSAPRSPAATAPEHVETSPDAVRDTERRAGPVVRREPMTTPARFALGAGVEARSFFGPETALVGPRALVLLPAAPSSAVRIRLDAGSGWAMARDALGSVSVTLASAGVGLAVMEGRGAIRFALGPKVELGWTWIRGTPSGTGARGATVNAAFGAASVEAILFAEIAPHWVSLAAIDVGVAFSGAEAQADARPVVNTAGLMLGAHVGLAYDL
jgi:hypothetical protein